ncbi:universal stress protein [Synechococcales cyanobacterium C]|uniref:Universal stress protein n=2 Tax=Petrachloros TaxID=2918834 RepID=A0A8K2A2G4_9CYAN|nr:universal stress protein [Petrachloros mirabilis ULC683]
MLVRLQGALGHGVCTNQMLLIPGEQSTPLSEDINLVVGYNGSAKSQAALDLTLWIAHQTRLATRKRVVVQAVYVLQSPQAVLPKAARDHTSLPHAQAVGKLRGSAVFTPTQDLKQVEYPAQLYRSLANDVQIQAFEDAEQILWQARSFAEEWRGSLNTHLRFGEISVELRQVAETENATLLLLGCQTDEHPLVRQMGKHFPCPVIGLPKQV